MSIIKKNIYIILLSFIFSFNPILAEEVKKIGKFTGIKVATVYGGQGMGIQLDALRNKPEIVVATPGRLIDHLNQ